MDAQIVIEVIAGRSQSKNVDVAGSRTDGERFGGGAAGVVRVLGDVKTLEAA